MADKSVYFIPEGSPVAPDLYDWRVRLRFKSKGVITAQGLKGYIDSLPDEASNAVVLNFNDIVSDEEAASSERGVTH